MHYFTQSMPQTLQQKAPLTGCLLGKIHGFCPPNRTYPPWPHLRYPLTSKDEDPNNKKLLGRVAHERRGHYCFISLTQDTMHYFTQSMPQTLQQKAPLTGCLLGKIHGFCPPNRTYPPWPHLRYPLTSKDEDPNKKILARQSCSRVQRTILFYLLYNNTTQRTDITS